MRLDTGVYRDKGGIAVVAKVGGHPKETRLPLDATRVEWLKARALLLEELGAAHPQKGPVGTLRRDIPRYLALVKHLAGWGEQKAHLQAWLQELGDTPRRRITRHDILRIRGAWIASGDVAPKTANNRVSALRALYHTLDGDDRPTPCDRIKPLPVHRTPAVAIDPAIILAVDEQLQRFEASGRLRDAKTRARFRVRAATGRRPSEIMRAEPTDVDLARRLWTPRDGKGGFTPGIYLTDDMLDAWKLFVAADAWGSFSTDSMAEVLRAAGWPAGVRPYQLRHSLGIALSEAGVDLADVQQMMGHKHQATTRAHYVPVLQSRLQRAAQTLEGRLPWTNDVTAAFDEELARRRQSVPSGGAIREGQPSGNRPKMVKAGQSAIRQAKQRKLEKSRRKARG